MSVTVKNIIPRKQAESSQTTQYTATNAKCIIDKFTVTNTSSSNTTISINLVPFGGTAGVDNLVTKTRSIVPNETWSAPDVVGQVLESGGFISTIASAASALTISASGREIT